MTFPLPTQISQDGDSLILKMQIMAEGAGRIVKIIPLTKNRLEDALQFVAKQYCAREPLLLAAQHASGCRLSNEIVYDYLKSYWSKHVNTSFMALNITQAFGANEDSFVESNADIVGVCFTRIVSQGEEFKLDGEKDISTSVISPPLRYFAKTIPSQVDVWNILKPQQSSLSSTETECVFSNHSNRLIEASSVTDSLLRCTMTEDVEDTKLSGLVIKQATYHPNRKILMEVGLIAVDPGFTLRRLGESLVAKCVELAAKSGCQIVKADCSNHFFFKVLSRFNFQNVQDFFFPDYIVDDSNTEPVDSVYPHKRLHIMALPLYYKDNAQ